ncbi:Transcriptional regulator, AbrB family, partial [Dysosmobacter welbionis]
AAHHLALSQDIPVDHLTHDIGDGHFAQARSHHQIPPGPACAGGNHAQDQSAVVPPVVSAVFSRFLQHDLSFPAMPVKPPVPELAS